MAPGAELGLIAAVTAAAFVQVRLGAQGTYLAESLVQLPHGESDADRQRHKFLLRSRDLAAVAFVGGFVGAPALGLIGLVFRALRRRG